MAAVTVRRHYRRSNEACHAIDSAGSKLQHRSAGKVSAFMLRAIRWYQVHISAHNPPCCKYYPSCSNYALEAVRRYGAVKGGLLAALRLLRCRPWSIGGIDDVPQHYSVFYRFSWSKAHEEPRLTPLPSCSDPGMTEETAGGVSTMVEDSAVLSGTDAPMDATTIDAKHTVGRISNTVIQNNTCSTCFKSSALKETTR